MRDLPDERAMYRAVLRRDASYDGVFFVAVRTTGVFCRPTCPARKPLRENTVFFVSPTDALQAGFRPCRRCRPLAMHSRPPAWVHQLMARLDAEPGRRLSDADLRAAGIDATRVRRHFQEHYGMTFHHYQRTRRLGRALADLRQGDDITAVGLRHGFQSTSGFRDAFQRVFGQPPGGGRDLPCLLACWVDSPLGPMFAAADDDGLCLLEYIDRRNFDGQLVTLCRRFKTNIVPGNNEHLERIMHEMEQYFAGTLTEFTVPVVLRGTPFELNVWRRLQQIPYGTTLSYAQLAIDIGRPGAQRAVGRANGVNRLAIIIPCHRVVRADGTLCGYGGGVWRKQRLLDLEREVAAGGS
ncbi:MAG: methylated-DNA--[protein]-cysteine S-methyltransferase [Phycisphaerae bacterium]|jgi:AraC family transcriptional regulator of adaptative response/methylated-DNA-[protein]-cysteine methyltransferase